MTKRVYCIAQFLPKPGKLDELFGVLQSLEPNTLREDGCLQYIVTRHVENPNADGETYPLVFNEIWADMEAFDRHCQNAQIQNFFQKECIEEDGLVEKWNVCVYSDVLSNP
jgi:quinol monooxygenase YgiN